MLYVEKELHPLGFRTISVKKLGILEKQAVLAHGHYKLLFECICPAHPNIFAMGCPLHHQDIGGSHPVEAAKKILTIT